MRSIAIRVLLLLALAYPASAGDGVLEINQVCAEHSGCFPGDSAGFPVTIDGTAGRSYRLSSDLVVPNENTDAIIYGAENVSIDLAGFEIRGPVVCSGSPLTCVPASGTGSGVERFGTTHGGLSLENGSISGMGGSGVAAGQHAEITGLRVSSNRLDGINVSLDSIVKGNVVHWNGQYGIFASSGSTVSGNAAYGNAAIGIYSNSGSTLSGNTVYSNGSDGIQTPSGSTVAGNTAYSNEDDGIQVATGSTVSGNTAYLNGSDGITTTSGCTVVGNTVRLNAGFGLNLGAQSGYRENVISGNSVGTVSGGVNAGDNVCNGLLTCP